MSANQKIEIDDLISDAVSLRGLDTWHLLFFGDV